jgi:hypothetical protein
MVVHALEAEFLNLVALAVHPWPFGRLQGLLNLRGSPVHQGLALGGGNDHKVPGIIRSALFPRPAIDLRAIFQGVHRGGLKALQTSRLVVIEQAQQASALGVECTGQRYCIDRPVDDNEGTPGCQGDLLAVGENDPRHMDVGRMLRHKDGWASFIMGNHSLRARHDAAQHGDLALGHRPPAPRGDHVPLDIDDLPHLRR